jgi:Cu(I)/Ag(I) efflux system membrane protein CusA/SilA
VIAGLITWCTENRLLVVLLVVVLVGVGLWAIYNIPIDAIPDLSDVQVIIRTEYPGQAPQIVEDQITYPLTTAMLNVPYAKNIRGYSMFGTSFVYIIFEDGTDIYWARSRVLEQLSVIAPQLPEGVSPKLGPDATGVGWIYEYMLITGRFCPAHPNGLWHDPVTDRWYANPDEAPLDDAIRARLKHFRTFPQGEYRYKDTQTGESYFSRELAPEDARTRLEKIEIEKGYERCPLDDTPLAEPDVDIAELRSMQDWYLRYELTALENVSEVATVGGFVKQYQVTIDPIRLSAYGISLEEIKQRIQKSNLDAGGSLIELSETEYMIRGIGYLGSLTSAETSSAGTKALGLERQRTLTTIGDLRSISLGATANGTPIYLRDVAQVAVGPDIRQGITEWNGEGEGVGGIIVMRFGENARTTINSVRNRLAELEKTLPPGVEIVTAYDRSDLIDRSIETLSHALGEEMLIVALVTILFLIHARSALVAVVVLPTGVVGSLLLMHLLGLNANIMSLGGIAIAIGVMVDSSIIMVENAHDHLLREKKRVEGGGEPRQHKEVIAEAATEVGPSLFFSLLIITVSFIPVFALGEQAGHLFKPLAFTKTFAMGLAALLAVTLIPALMFYFIRERLIPSHWPLTFRLVVYGSVITIPAVLLAFVPLPILAPFRWWLVGGWLLLSSLLILPQKILSEERNPLSLLLELIYNPIFTFAMHYRWLIIIGSVIFVLVSIWPFLQLGSEFMPPLEEGDLLYMPTTDPGLSITKARELLQQTDRLIKQFPEVVGVMGKIGRAETATDPAPMSMIETTIQLERDKSKWRQLPSEGLGRFWGETRPITIKELVDGFDLPDGRHAPGINDALHLPGLTGALTIGSMPIKTRIDMLSTGIKSTVGIKILGPDLNTLSDLSDRVVQVFETDQRVQPFTASVTADRTLGGNYINIIINRDQIARYGLTVADVQETIMTALGGMNITSTIEGRGRYPVNIRYPRELRDDIPSLRDTLVATPSGAQIPLAQLVDFEVEKGPSMIRSENARLTSWVYIDARDIDLGSFVERAKQAVAEGVVLPAGYSITWSGQYEYMEAANRALVVIIPVVFIAILFLLYLATHSWICTILIVVTLSFSVAGAVWMLYFYHFDLSLAVWIGIIALAGLAAETSVVMLLFLDNSFDRFKREERMRDLNDLRSAVHHGSVKRIKPKTMTVMTTMFGLLPLMYATGAGADIMHRLAAPMIGGLITGFILELLVYPVIFYVIKKPAVAREAAELKSKEPPADEASAKDSLVEPRKTPQDSLARDLSDYPRPKTPPRDQTP